MFIDGPDKQLTRFAVGLSKGDPRVLVGFITGDTVLNRHLMMVRSNPIRSTCKEQKKRTKLPNTM